MASVIARRYAAAFLEVARDLHRVDELGAELDRAREILTDPRVAAALASPRHGVSVRATLAADLLAGLSDPTRNLVRLLIQHGRLGELDGVAAELHAMIEAAAGVVSAAVTAAVDLDDGTQAEISRVLGARLGRQVRVVAARDPGVLGGLVVRIGDRVIDSSLRSTLDQLQASLA